MGGGALDALDNIASTDIELASTVARASWFANSITENEWRALNALENIASKDIELANAVVRGSWFADGTTDSEWAGPPHAGKNCIQGHRAGANGGKSPLARRGH